MLGSFEKEGVEIMTRSVLSPDHTVAALPNHYYTVTALLTLTIGIHRVTLL